MRLPFLITLLALDLLHLSSACTQPLDGVTSACGESFSWSLRAFWEDCWTDGFSQRCDEQLIALVAQSCESRCIAEIERVFESCRQEDSEGWEQFESTWKAVSETQCLLQSLPSWTRVRRSSSSFVLSDFNLDNPDCVKSIQGYGNICYSIFGRVVSDIEAFKAIRSIGAYCNGSWVKCFSNLNTAGGKLDPILKRLEPDFTRMCEYKCWNKTFDVVEHCVRDTTNTVSSLLNERDLLLNVLQVHCTKNQHHKSSCGQLEIEFYLSQQEAIAKGAKACNGSQFNSVACPDQCKVMMKKAVDSLGCCVRSQQLFASVNKLSDPLDVLANQTYWDQHHCNIQVPGHCTGTIISQFRQVSGSCKNKLDALNNVPSCPADWYKFQLIVMLTREAGLANYCNQSQNCMSTVNFYIRSLADDAHTLCSSTCHLQLIASLRSCSAELQNSSSTAFVPLTLLCYNKTSTRPSSSDQNCAVQYQMYMSRSHFTVDPCTVPSSQAGQCPSRCLQHLKSLTHEGLGCCFASQLQDNITGLQVDYLANLKACMPSVGGGTQKPCGHYVQPSRIPTVVPGPKSMGSNVAAVVGGVVAGVGLLAVLGVFAFWYLKQKKGKDNNDDGSNDEDDGFSYKRVKTVAASDTDSDD